MGEQVRRRTTIARVVVAVSSLLIVLGAARVGLEHIVDRHAGWTPAIAGAPPNSAVPGRAGTAADGTVSTAATTGAATDPEGAVQACVRKQAAATAVVLAAQQAESDWRQHVQGQTALDAGEMTLPEVKDRLWGPTRKAGPSDVVAYVRATESYDALPACQAPSGAPTVALEGCLARQAALDAVLSAAAPVVDDWRGHLGAMARHAVGLLTDAQAQEDWVRRWTASGPHLLDLATAESALAEAPDCRA